MKNRIAALIVLAGILLALLPAPVRADVAPPPIPLVGGVGPFEYQDTNVQMVSERVEMELMPQRLEDGDFVFYRDMVEVHAWFVMRNTGSQDETMQVVFPLSDMNCYGNPQDANLAPSYTYLSFTEYFFEVYVNGKPAEVTNMTTPNPCNPEYLELLWAAFDVAFPVQQDVVIRVSYLIDRNGDDEIFNVGYTLETGAAWKGPIGEAIIVFRFPYVVEGFIMPGTTQGYRVMQNEIYWRYENFEPRNEDNINVAFIDPYAWGDIRDSRKRIEKNPQDEAAWVTLTDRYTRIAYIHGPNIRSKEYRQKAYTAFENGLKANPDSAMLNASYARLLKEDCCYYEQVSPSDWQRIRPYLEKALKQDPSNERALELVEWLRSDGLEIDITPGPTFTPTITMTSTVSSTPTITPTQRATRTPKNTKTPTIAPSDTAAPPTQTVTPIVQGEKTTAPESNRINWWERAALIASGFGLGIAVMWVQKRQSQSR